MLNIVSDPIVSREKIIFSPLHIKLGLMKQFVKALDRNRECFLHIVSFVAILENVLGNKKAANYESLIA